MLETHFHYAFHLCKNRKKISVQKLNKLFELN
jgi:hypothetical protein